MPGILIIAHAPLASALGACAAHVYAGTPAGLEIIDVAADDKPEAILTQAHQAALRAAGVSAATLVLVDVAGATPCNIARLLERDLASGLALRVVAGVNLPMLLRTLCYQHESLDALAQRAIDGGRRGIEQLDDAPARDNQGSC